MKNKVTKAKMKEYKKKFVKLIMIILIGLVLIISVLAIVNRNNFRIDIQKPKPTPVYLEDEGYSLDGEVKTKSREDILKELK